MDNFIGEIRPFAFSWYPNDWLPCDGRLLMVNQFQALYAVIGNLYGGTANVNFNLPNLQGAVLVGAGIAAATHTPYIQGSTGATGGANNVTLTQSTIPSHTHTFNGAIGGGVYRKSIPEDLKSYISNFAYTPTNGSSKAAPGYVTSPPSPPDTQLNIASISPAGAGSQHENRQPYLAINYCIAYEGNFPIRP